MSSSAALGVVCSGLPLAANSGTAGLALSIEGGMDDARIVQPDVIGTSPSLMEQL